MNATFQTDTELDSIIEMLSKCSAYDYVFSKDISDLNEFDRSMLVGSFNRLKTSSNEDYGKDLLLEFFSRDTQKFNEKLTKDKLYTLHGFFPLSIEYLHKKYNVECEYCRENEVKNIFELLDGVNITELENNNTSFIKWVIQAEKSYLRQNDEVALNHIYDELNSLEVSQLEKNLSSLKMELIILKKSMFLIAKKKKSKEPSIV